MGLDPRVFFVCLWVGSQIMIAATDRSAKEYLKSARLNPAFVPLHARTLHVYSLSKQFVSY